MCTAGTLLPVMNGLVQVLSARYSSEQIVWARTASHLVFVLALFAPRLGAGVVRTLRGSDGSSAAPWCTWARC